MKTGDGTMDYSEAKHPPTITMSNLNKVILIGRLTRDPMVRHTPKGTACTEFGLAVNRSFTAETGEKREETTFVDLTFWGKTADIAAKYLHKGNLTCVEGRLKMESWIDKTTGQARSKLAVVGENLILIEPSSSANPRTPAANTPSPRVSQPTTAIPAEANDDWDEPF